MDSVVKCLSSDRSVAARRGAARASIDGANERDDAMSETDFSLSAPRGIQ